MVNYVFFITAISDYKAKMFELLTVSSNCPMFFYAGSEAFDNSVKIDLKFPCYKVNNIFLLNRRLLLQWPISKQVLNSDILILDLNPRVISVWLLMFFRFFKKKKTVLYGHAFPRAGSKSISRFFRYIQVAVSTHSIVYTHTEIENYPKFLQKKMSYCGNALYHSNQIYAAKEKTKRNIVIFSGRLTADKNPFFLLRAFERFKMIIESDAVLVFFGDGSLRLTLEQYVASSKWLSKDNVRFLGHLTDIKTIRGYYDTAACSVVPGFVGLQAVQSICFGVPVVFPFSVFNAPEVSYLIDGFNSIGFEEGNEEQLISILLSFFRENEVLLDHNLIAQHAKKYVALESMVTKMRGVLNEIASSI